MSKINRMFNDGNRLKIALAAGAVILVVGFLFQWYPINHINGLKTSLKQPNLMIEEIWKLQGSFDWWSTQQITVFQPVSLLLYALGGILLVYSMINVLLGTSHLRIYLSH
jgi:hypothetical protein